MATFNFNYDLGAKRKRQELERRLSQLDFSIGQMGQNPAMIAPFPTQPIFNTQQEQVLRGLLPLAPDLVGQQLLGATFREPEKPLSVEEALKLGVPFGTSPSQAAAMNITPRPEEKPLSVEDVLKLGVPFGTTPSQAASMGITPSTPIQQTELERQLDLAGYTKGTEEFQNAARQRLNIGQPVDPYQFLDPDIKEYRQAINAGLAPFDTSFKDYMTTYRRPQTEVNIGTEKALGDNAKNWRNAKGEQPLATLTISEAVAKGFSPRTTGEIENVAGAAGATPVISQMIEIGFGKQGEKSLFPPAGTGLGSRTLQGVSSYLQGVTDSDLRNSLYLKSKEAFTTQLARLVGQVGVLTERDVETVKGLYPTPGFTPDPQAKAQFKAITKLLMGKGIPKDMLTGMGMPKWAFDDEATPSTGGWSIKEKK